jgi:hypothetical protein
MENTVISFEEKESSAVWESGKGSFPEAECGAAGQNPVEHRACETPLIGEVNLSFVSQILEGGGLRGRMLLPSIMGVPFTGNSESYSKGSSGNGASLSMGALVGNLEGGLLCWGPGRS